jgi:hypothetical protein
LDAGSATPVTRHSSSRFAELRSSTKTSGPENATPSETSSASGWSAANITAPVAAS